MQRGGTNGTSAARTMAGYGLMVLAAIGLFFAIRAYGETLTARSRPPAPTARDSVQGSMASGWLLHLLVALAAVIIVGRLLAWLFA